MFSVDFILCAFVNIVHILHEHKQYVLVFCLPSGLHEFHFYETGTQSRDRNITYVRVSVLRAAHVLCVHSVFSLQRIAYCIYVIHMHLPAFILF